MRKILLSLPLWGLWAPSTGFAGKHAIVGQIIDRRGEPLEEATVTLVGRNAAMPTDENGWFRIDYLRTNDGKQTRLDKRTTYVVNITMVGFHETELEVTYKRGELKLEPIELTPETVAVQDMPAQLLKAVEAPTGNANGVVREGH